MTVANVLNPEWVTKGVYQILNSHELSQSKGILKRRTLEHILDPILYPRAKHLFIIDMMRKFELCFDFEGEANERFLIPELLQKDEPDTGNWQDSLAFEYHYDVLPSSIISRFIVRMHPYISKNTYWRNGVVLVSEGQGNRALVKADSEDRKIFIKVAGKEDTRRQFLELIRADFLKIRRSIPDIKVKQKIPLPNYPDIVVDYEHLINLETLGEETFVPEGLLEKISVKQLLYGIDESEEKTSNIISSTQIVDEKTSEPKHRKNNPWVSGSFYIFVFVIVMGTFGIMGNYVAWYILPIAFIAGLIAIPIVGVLQSLNDGTLSEKGFLTVIIESYKRLVLLRDKTLNGTSNTSG
ncbi:MAG: hypothetical protein GY797_37640 [Deltaproteobacteria bacterium]|nr:hypothetical protein [Deltaproteobacteria bacterium]